ncbi:MAG TPA: hypothetical protein VJ914_36215 [Pseudonocardiaceae bacterium]|nr:hypothetical protein [Pseudonocardiaceae bacterium]
MSLHRARAGWLVTGVVITSIMGTGVAFAYWNSTGSGTGTATDATMNISAAALAGETPNSTLYPGGSADAILKVDNPNGYAVQVVSIVSTGAAQAGNSCSPTGVRFVAPSSFTDPQFTLPADQTTVLHLSGAMSMDTTSASACQGQTFSLPVTVTVKK